MTSTNNKIRKEAAMWFTRMQSADADHVDRSKFEQWLLSSDVHAQEYQAFANMMDSFADNDKLQSLADIIQANKQQRASQTKAQRSNIMRGVLSIFAIAITALIVTQGWSQWQKQPVMQMASTTSIGQTKVQKLEDGSQLTLNANTDVNITFYRNKRSVTLIKGEVVFDVAKDASRPFVIDSGNTRVTVLGTRFAINRLQNLMRISVDHGTVKVDSIDVNGQVIAPSTLLNKGEVAETYTDNAANQPAKKVNRNAEGAFSFINGYVSFEQADLPEIAETLSRYSKHPITVPDSAFEQVDTHKTTVLNAPELQTDVPQTPASKITAPKITAIVQMNNIDGFLNLLPRIASVEVKNADNKTLLIVNKNHQ